MKNLKSKILSIGAGVALSISPLEAQTQEVTKPENNQPKWETVIGIQGMFPNDSDLREVFHSYFGMYGEAQRKLDNDLYLGVSGTIGFGEASNDDYTLRANKLELSALLLYKKEGFEIGIGPVLANLELTETHDREENSYSISGLGLGGKAKYVLIDWKKVDISIVGAYSKVKPGDEEYEDLQLGTTKIGLNFSF